MDTSSLDTKSSGCRDERLATLGRAIRDCRKARGWTQTDLACQINCSEGKAYISRIEKGKANISVAILCKIADALEVPVHELTAGM